MKATLINPAVAWDALDASWIRSGIGSISAYAKSKGHQIDLIDLRRLVKTGDNGSFIDWSLFENLIRQSNSEVFGLSVLSANFDFAFECIQRIQKIKSEAKIAVGGIHVTVQPKESKILDADYYIYGEGELAFTQILEGRWKVEDAGHHYALAEKEKIDLDSLPFVDRELFAPLREVPIGYLEEPFHTIIIGRGCPYKCSFCYPAETTLFGKKVRMRSVDNVLTELLELKAKYGLASFTILDDAFTSFPKYITEFVEGKAKALPEAKFYCQGRADQITKWPEMFKELYKVGLRIVSVGFESGSQRVLDFLRKGTTVEQNIKAAEILNEIGIDIWGNLMIGIPTETTSEVIETVQMAKRIKEIQPRAILSWASFTPHPGSDLFEYCKENNLSLIKHSADYRRYFEPNNPKIKGVDYNFLAWAVSQV